MKTSSNLPDPIVDYLKFLNSADSTKAKIVNKDRIERNREGFEKAIEMFLAYPDRLVDLMTPRDSHFQLYFVQRIVLRAMSRHRQSYFTFTRAFSKSFLAFLSQYIFTMLVPRHRAFIVSGTKQQAAAIAKEKVVGDLWNKFPLLAAEMVKMRVGGQLQSAYVQGKDYAEFRFTHGGIFDVIGSGSSTRGGRRHSGLFEEVIEHDADEINEVVLPLMNKERTNAKGLVNPNEPHGKKIFVTTAGYTGTFAYDKLIETVCYTVLDPQRYIVLGGSYQIPLMHKLLDEQAMKEVLSSPSFDPGSVDREYKSIWSGSQVGAAFSADRIRDLRKIKYAEYSKRKPTEDTKNDFYVVSADMAKDGSANTAVIVYKVRPKEFNFMYYIVNAFQIDTSDYQLVSAKIKQTLAAYEARLFVYDANGIGAALRDWLNKEQLDPDGSGILPAYGIINPPKASEKDVKKVNRDMTICYEIKASGEVNGHINKIFFSKMSTSSLRILQKSSFAVDMLSQTTNFASASSAKKKQMLAPYHYIDKLEEEMRNLDIVDASDMVNPNNLKIKQRNSKIQKDFYSAASYGIYGVNVYLEMPHYSKKRKKDRNIADYIKKW